MAEKNCLLLWLSVTVLISFAEFAVTAENVKCEVACAQNYSQNADKIAYCCRGCRLMRLADFTNYGPQSQNAASLLETCLHSCATAYGGESSVTGSSSVCQNGCKLELSAVENRQRQLQLFYYEQSKYMQMFDMINRLVSCQMQSFMYGPRQIDRSGDRYFSARMVFISSNGGSVRSISVSRGSGPAVTSVESKGRGELAKSGYKLKDRLLEGKSRLYTRIDAADPAVILLFLFGLVLLIGLSVSLCYPVQHTAPESKPQKLSIYGDGDLLSTLDDEDTLIDIKPRAQLFVAAPLPAKHAL